MRVRIIFRGLILFRFERRSDNPDAECDRGELTAWLVSDPKHARTPLVAQSYTSMGALPAPMPPHTATAPEGTAGGHDDPDGHAQAHAGLHVHVPYIGIYGRYPLTENDVAKNQFKAVGIPLQLGETRFALVGHGTKGGVFTTPGFEKHVPRLGDLSSQVRGDPDPHFVTSKIVVPHGKLRARDLVSWDAYGNQPAEVAFMGTKYRGFVANEAVLDMGDDESDYWRDDKRKFLSITSTTPEVPTQLWPLTKGTNYVPETDPNTVEILITNFAPQRRRSVFWSLHYQSLLDAAGFTRNDAYVSSPQFEEFEKFATIFDAHEWTNDRAGMKLGQPFPYIIPQNIRPADGLRAHLTEAIATRVPPDIAVRKGWDGLPPTKGVDAPADAGMPPMPGPLVTHDPWSRPICPLGQDDDGGGM